MNLDLLVLAVRNILNRKRRSWLTVIGIFIGIAAVVSLIALGQGLDRAITSEFEAIGADKIFINTGGDPGGGSASGLVQSATALTDQDVRAVRRTRGVADATTLQYKSAQVTYRDTSEFIVVTGAPTGEGSELFRESFAVEMAEGRWLRPADRFNIVIGSTIAESTFGEDVGIRSKMEFSGHEFRVVGVLEPVGDPGVDGGIIMPQEAMKDIYDLPDEYDYVVARVQDGFEPEDVKDQLERELRQSRNVDEGEEDFSVSTPQDIIASFRNILGIVQAIVVGIASISLLVGGVGITNTMYTAVTERTREIGVMKAVGAEDWQILVLFLMESGMIGLVGGIMGVLVGAGISQGFAIVAGQYSAIPLQAALSPELIAGSLAFAFSVGAISGTLPARNAAKLDPVDALRYE